jgi:sugar lactone lactonase YvrE
MGLALDTRGNLYIADPGARRVRRVATDGNIYLAAGNGSSGYSGDGSLAVLAQLKEPLALAVDASGNLLILDAGDFRIRKVTPDGNIVTAFGTGTEGLAGDGGPAAAAQFGRVTGLALDASGNLYLASPAHRRVRKIEGSGIMSTIAGTALID